MEDYLIALRSRDNTPASLLRMDKQHEEEMINNYTSDIKAKIQGKKKIVKSMQFPVSTESVVKLPLPVVNYFPREKKSLNQVE